MSATSGLGCSLDEQPDETEQWLHKLDTATLESILKKEPEEQLLVAETELSGLEPEQS